MSEHTTRITLTGGDLPEPTFPGIAEAFADVGKVATVTWRDGDEYGEIVVDRTWKRHAGTQDKNSAMTVADAVAGRVINWVFVEFAR